MMRPVRNPWTLALALVLLAAPSRALEPIVDCKPRGRARPVCGFQNPEDLAALPGDAALVVSEAGGPGAGRPGRLSLFVLAGNERRPLFQGGDAKGPPSSGWGDPRCPGPPEAFTPHGIDVLRRPNGPLELAVVQHAGRESIELFELIGYRSAWRVEWRGCALAPPGSFLNDVAIRADGTLYATHMGPREDLDALFEGRAAPGHVLRWTPEEGFERLKGSGGRLPNGLALSRDETKLLVNYSLENQLRRIDLEDGAVDATVAIPRPDNSTWAPNGRLLVASLGPASREDLVACRQLARGACPLPFKIFALYSGTLEKVLLYEAEGPPMGAGTVGLRIGDELFVGSFAGDRLLRVKLDPEALR